MAISSYIRHTHSIFFLKKRLQNWELRRGFKHSALWIKWPCWILKFFLVRMARKMILITSPSKVLSEYFYSNMTQTGRYLSKRLSHHGKKRRLALFFFLPTIFTYGKQLIRIVHVGKRTTFATVNWRELIYFYTSTTVFPSMKLDGLAIIT